MGHILTTGHSLSAIALEHLSSITVASSKWPDGGQSYLACAHTSTVNTRHSAANNDFKAGKTGALQITRMFQLVFYPAY